MKGLDTVGHQRNTKAKSFTPTRPRVLLHESSCHEFYHPMESIKSINVFELEANEAPRYCADCHRLLKSLRLLGCFHAEAWLHGKLTWSGLTHCRCAKVKFSCDTVASLGLCLLLMHFFQLPCAVRGGGGVKGPAARVTQTGTEGIEGVGQVPDRPTTNVCQGNSAPSSAR